MNVLGIKVLDEMARLTHSAAIDFNSLAHHSSMSSSLKMRRKVESVASCSGSFSLFLHLSASSLRRRGDSFPNGCMSKSVCLNNFMIPSREDGSGSQSSSLEGTLLFGQGAYKNEEIINIDS